MHPHSNPHLILGLEETGAAQGRGLHSDVRQLPMRMRGGVMTYSSASLLGLPASGL
jgi:hypothetical protein